MAKIICNIDKTDRINRSIFGVVLIIAALLGASMYFYLILGAILIVEGIIGWCSVPIIVSLVERLKK